MQLRFSLLLFCGLAAWSWPTTTAIAAENATAEPLGGWYGLFPHVHYYRQRFEAPVIEQKESTALYRQTVSYELGERWTVTLARDPAFKDRYAADTLRKQKDGPQEVRIQDKFTAWVWSDSEKRPKRAVVLLAEDKAIVAEGGSPPSGAARPYLEALLLINRFDLERVRVALDKPPRTSFEPRLEDFKVIPKSAPLRDFAMWIDWEARVPKEPVADLDKNLVYTWVLSPRSRVLVALTPDKVGKVVYIKHDQGEGKLDDLVK